MPRVTESNVFCIPRYFPFYQVASRSGPFEFFGFTTSVHQNRPQFLVGANYCCKPLEGLNLQMHFEWVRRGWARYSTHKESQLSCHRPPSHHLTRQGMRQWKWRWRSLRWYHVWSGDLAMKWSWGLINRQVSGIWEKAGVHFPIVFLLSQHFDDVFLILCLCCGCDK